MRCTPKTKLASLAHERENLLLKCRQFVHSVTTAFAEKLHIIHKSAIMFFATIFSAKNDFHQVFV